MADDLIYSSPSQALVLADARHERALATLDDGPKRKAKWLGQAAPKKGKRWGLSDDKPFKPLPYVDLPVGLSDVEVDQFLREQRLEDLHRKLQLQQLEEVDPDIRPPSPPPIYDKAGARLNTRDVRIRKSMLAEYNRLIRYMIKNLEGYEPPPDWKPQKLSKKIIIPYERYPQAPFMGVIIGARGVNHKHLQETTGCRIFIRGKDIGDRFQSDEEALMPQHVHIEAELEEQIDAAEQLLIPLLDPTSPEFEYARTHGMQQVAICNGFTLTKTEQRCGVCGAVGHLGFECPEVTDVSYKMANIVCTICGDKGHVASDCKVAAEQHQKENVDWKAEAERKQNLEQEYDKMMGELGMKEEKRLSGKEPPSQVPTVMPPTREGHVAVPPARAPRPTPPRIPAPIRPAQPELCNGGAARPAGAAAKASRPAVPGTAFAAIRPALVRPSPLQPTGSLRPAAGGRPVRPQAASGAFVGARPHVVAPASRLTALQTGTQHTGGLHARSFAAESMAVKMEDSVPCPPELTYQLRCDADCGVFQEMSQDTGAEVTPAVDGRRILIQGPPEARERARLHLRCWIDANLRSIGVAAAAPAFTPPAFPGDGGFPPGGFPPGMAPPPGGLPPGSFPLDGFPPRMAPPPGGLPPGFPPAGFPPGFPSTLTAIGPQAVDVGLNGFSGGPMSSLGFALGADGYDEEI